MKISDKLKEKIKLVYHPKYKTDYVTASCEKPDRVTSIISHFEDFSIIKPQPCSEEDILLCHSEGILMVEKQERERYETACLAVGGAIETARLALDGYISFGVIRPPGHHAGADHNWGFCFFNNMAIAVTRLLKDRLISNAVILDIDLHFGDGTDSIFEYDKDVSVLNIQSSTPEGFLQETEEALDSIVSADILGISAGFDQYEKDWGGNLSTEDYYKIGCLAGSFAREKTGGKIFSILEGGYYIPDLADNVTALVKGIAENAVKL